MVAFKNLSITSAVVLGLSGQIQAAPITSSELVTRSGTESDLDVRDPFIGRLIGSVFGGRKGRRNLEELTERDLDELKIRDPFIGRLIGSVFGGRRGRRDLEELSERDLELEERSTRNRGSGLARHAISTAGRVGVAFANNMRRDLEEFDERDLDDLEERDDGLETRDPFIGRLVGSIFGGRRGRRDLGELDERDIDELEERDYELETRDPFIGRLIGSVFGGRKGRRDLEELASRDLDDGSLVARELESLDERDLDYLYSLYLRDIEDEE
ncbi:unnamed protein product [Clonostachys rosea]|uniref:Uncharacterized protein n=1 Tax=Bionectria ochroleuca TaxID=29856 RepID=A0ABY6UHM5_BIOOC|nr:unnamed protein product [Clonostachys rosea]